MVNKSEEVSRRRFLGYSHLAFLSILTVVFFYGFNSLPHYVMKPLQKDFTPIQGQYKSGFSREDSLSWNDIMEERQNRAKRVCEKYPILRLMKPVFYGENPLVWQKEFNLAYCRNAKAGTTSWLYLFYNLTTEKKFLNKNKRKAHYEFPPPSLNQNFTTTFTMVRHPLPRFVSGYKDLFSRGKSIKMGKIAFLKYRTENTSTEFKLFEELSSEIGIDVTKKPTIKEYGMYVIDVIENCIMHNVGQECYDRLDIHIRPVYSRCSPCYNHYDAILKAETFHNDFMHLKEVVRGKFIEERKYGNKHLKPKDRKELHRFHKVFKPSHAHKSSGLSTEVATKRFMKLLPKLYRQRLKRVYFFDFILFGYDPNKYDP